MADNLKKYFKDSDSEVIFTGKTLEVFIPKRYETFDLVLVQDVIKTLGIFEMVIDSNIKKGFLLPALITMVPHETYSTTIDGIDYYVGKFITGDKFMTSKTILKQGHIAYFMFLEFISLGNLPKFLGYEEVAFLFDKAVQMCGVKLNFNHSVFEMIYAHLFRDPNDLTKKYRHTDMKKKPSFIELRSVTWGPDSTSSKLIGSYLGDGLNSALVNQADQPSELENLFRM